MHQKYQGEERRTAEPVGWHLKKEVNLSIILAMLGLAITGFWGFADLKKDIELLKANAVVLHDRDNKAELDMHDAMAQVRDQYKELSAKLDRVIERGQK